MATVHSVLEALEDIAPARFAFDFDKVGLQVGEQQQVVSKGVVSLDRSLAAVEFAASIGAQVLVAHHPLIFRPIDSVSNRTHVGRTILKLAQSNIAFIAGHRPKRQKLSRSKEWFRSPGRQENLSRSA